MGVLISRKVILSPPPSEEENEAARALPSGADMGVKEAEEVLIEPTLARNSAAIGIRNPEQKFSADERAEVAPVKPTEDCSYKPNEVDALFSEEEGAILLDEGIGLKPAVVVGLDLLDASALPSGEVEDALKPKVNDARKNKVKLALPASCSKTPLPASGKGKEVAVVPKLSEASAMKTEQKFYRSNYSIVSRTPRHNPKPRRPKNNRQKGIDLWGVDGNVRIPAKEIVQDNLVTEYNNVLKHLIKMELRLNEMIQLCEPAHKKREKVLRLALKISLEDDAMIDLILRAFKSEKYFEVLASNLKHVLNWNRTVSWRIRLEVIRLGGKPINDPLSVFQR